jgi:predicted oxidoreductase
MAVSRITLCPDGPEFSRLAQGFGSILRSGIQNAVEMHAYISACLEEGITTFDHAAVYSDGQAETLFGEVLARDPALRQTVQIVTKCGILPATAGSVHMYDTSRAHLVYSAERSLQRMRTDYLDLLLIHRPDPLMDADEVAEAFTALRNAGKVRYFGVSNHTPSQFTLLASRFDFPLATNEVEFSALNMQVLYDGTLDLFQRLRISPLTWGPLGGGKLFTHASDQAARVRTALREVGEMLGGAPIDQVALAWVMKHPARVVPILGTGSAAEMRSHARADQLQLNRDQWFRIWMASENREVP